MVCDFMAAFMPGTVGRDLVRKSLKNSGGSPDFENRFFIESISTAIAGHACFLICSGRLKNMGSLISRVAVRWH